MCQLGGPARLADKLRMNLVDLGVLAIIFVSALLGLSRGLVRELLGLGAWVLAGYGAYLYGPQAVPAAQQAIGNPDVAEPVAYVVVFVVLLIILSLIANLVGRLVRISALGGLDKTLGLVFGVARGAALLVAAYIPLALLLPPERWPEAMLRARSLPWIYDGSVWASNNLPQGFQPKIPPPPTGPETTEADLLHATPEGRALGPAPARP